MKDLEKQAQSSLQEPFIVGIQVMIATEPKSDNFSSVLDHLDQFGLTPNQFRVYCHLFKAAVDGIVSESSQSIARICKLTRITVIRVLSQLAKMHLLQCDRTPDKKLVFYLTPFSTWCMPANGQNKQTNIQHTKVVQLRVSHTNTCKADKQVNEIHTQQEGQEPLKGSCHLQDVKVVNQSNQLSSNTSSLDEKLAAARERGWWDAGTWWTELGIQMVTVNATQVSVTQFMQRSLDSFEIGREICAEGLRMCRAQIEKIKLKKHQQRQSAIAITEAGNQLARGF